MVLLVSYGLLLLRVGLVAGVAAITFVAYQATGLSRVRARVDVAMDQRMRELLPTSYPPGRLERIKDRAKGAVIEPFAHPVSAPLRMFQSSDIQWASSLSARVRDLDATTIHQLEHFSAAVLGASDHAVGAVIAEERDERVRVALSQLLPAIACSAGIGELRGLASKRRRELFRVCVTASGSPTFRETIIKQLLRLLDMVGRGAAAGVVVAVLPGDDAGMAALSTRAGSLGLVGGAIGSLIFASQHIAVMAQTVVNETAFTDDEDVVVRRRMEWVASHHVAFTVVVLALAAGLSALGEFLVSHFSEL